MSYTLSISESIPVVMVESLGRKLSINLKVLHLSKGTLSELSLHLQLKLELKASRAMTSSSSLAKGNLSEEHRLHDQYLSSLGLSNNISWAENPVHFLWIKALHEVHGKDFLIWFELIFLSRMLQISLRCVFLLMAMKNCFSILASLFIWRKSAWESSSKGIHVHFGQNQFSVCKRDFLFWYSAREKCANLSWYQSWQESESHCINFW